MIDAILSTVQGTATSRGSAGIQQTGSGAGSFDAALKAAEAAASRQRAHASEVDAIKTKGFSAWARDTQVEALKEKLRKQVMADMGIDEDSLSRLSAAMRDILEKKIQEEIERRMQEQAEKNQEENGGKGGTTVASAQPPGNNDRSGKDCPVIPALAWPGAPSLF